MEKLNVLEQEKVTDAYLEHGGLVKQVAKKFAYGSRFNASDIESYLNERFIKMVLNFDASKTNKGLGAYLNAVLTKHAINYTKSGEATYSKNNVPFSTFDGDDDGGTFEETTLTDGTLFEHTVHAGHEVTSALHNLFANATERQKTIMRAYLDVEGKASYTQIGNMVGLGHEQVKRELAKLAKVVDFDLSVLTQPQYAKKSSPATRYVNVEAEITKELSFA